jgi:undecaprenyl-diphosphatase
MKSAPEMTLSQVDSLIAGFVTAFIVALLSIKFLLRFIQTHTFIPFGVYRIILVVVLLIHLKMA